jgi:hypothetical protein
MLAMGEFIYRWSQFVCALRWIVACLADFDTSSPCSTMHVVSVTSRASGAPRLLAGVSLAFNVDSNGSICLLNLFISDNGLPAVSLPLQIRVQKWASTL